MIQTGSGKRRNCNDRPTGVEDRELRFGDINFQREVPEIF